MRSDVDTLLVPLLKQLHGSDSRTASQTYMLLIIVLILSQVRNSQVPTAACATLTCSLVMVSPACTRAYDHARDGSSGQRHEFLAHLVAFKGQNCG